MKHFYAIVHKDEDSAFGVQFPDIPGCFSAADTMDEIVPNAIEALSLWFEDEDEDDVEPNALEQVRACASEELAEGAFLLAIPYIVRSGRMSRVNVSFDSGMLAAIDAAAAARHQTRSGFLAEAARDAIEGR